MVELGLVYIGVHFGSHKLLELIPHSIGPGLEHRSCLSNAHAIGPKLCCPRTSGQPFRPLFARRVEARGCVPPSGWEQDHGRVGAVSDPSGSYPGFKGEVGKEFNIFPSFVSNLNTGFVEVHFPRGIPREAICSCASETPWQKMLINHPRGSCSLTPWEMSVLRPLSVGYITRQAQIWALRMLWPFRSHL